MEGVGVSVLEDRVVQEHAESERPKYCVKNVFS